MREIKYPYIIKDGEGKVSNSKSFKKELEGLKDGRYELVIRKLIKKRSTAQNAYYWSCMIPAVIDGLIDIGFNSYDINAEIVHDMLKQKFLKKDIANEDGLFIEVTQSTTELSTSGFMDYIVQIQQWAAEFLSISIPDPGEQSEINF